MANEVQQANPVHLEEYKDLSSNMRQYANMRFAQLTLFIAMTAGLLNLLFGSNHTTSDPLRDVLKGIGILITVVFWIMEERAVGYWNHFRHRAVELERELGFRQYSTRPERTLIRSSNAARLLYGAIMAFWLTALLMRNIF